MRRKRYTAKEREQLIGQVRTFGEPVKVVAKRMGVCAATAYRWMKDVPATKKPEFARLVPTRGAAAAIAVEVGTATIHVAHGFDAELLRAVVFALGSGST